ncbi:MAG: class I SAM-dependent methyltransferase [Hyphomicrobium sp.]
MSELQKLYDKRFQNTGLSKRDAVWKTLCASYFQRLIPENATVLDLACGYGEFINNIRAAKKYGVDLNPDSPTHLNGDVTFFNTPATELQGVPPASVDVVFTSNFLEHLRSKEDCNTVLGKVLGVLKPGGSMIVMGPNIRYAYAEYWDYYDHYLPLSHLSLAEGLSLAGFDVERVIPRFLPFTMNNNTPTHPLLVKAYLSLPIAWKIMGKQFLVVARKPAK